MDRNPRILVVDDNKGSRLALSTLLQDEGYEVETARNGADALQCLDEHEIDLVVSDVQMHGLDGFELVRRLQRKSKSRDLPVILVSGKANPDRRSKGHNLGAEDFLVKPLDFDALLARTQTHLRHWQRHRQQRQALVDDPRDRILTTSGILAALAAILEAAQKDQSSTSVLLIESSDSEGRNDTSGHQAANDALPSVAEDLESSLRIADRVGRLVGGEYLVVLANTELGDAQGVARRLRHSASLARLPIGAATAQVAELPERLLRRAAEATKAETSKPLRISSGGV